MLLPIINLVIALVVSLLVFIDPKLNKLDAEVRASLCRTVKIVRLGITGLLSIISLIMLAAALGWLKEGAQFSRIIYASIAGLFILLGNFMTKLRPNYFIGIRTPWTLESKEVWIKTHRVVSRLMMLGGILMFTLCFLMSPERYVFWVQLPVVATIAVFSILYSFVIYKKQGPVQQPSA